jgi:hypothetical protein
MTAERIFADAETLTPVMREVFGTYRRIATVDRLPNGTKKGVYRVEPRRGLLDGLLPDGHDDPSNPFAHASGIDFFESATRRLEAVGIRSPRLLLADRSKNLYPADIAVAEDVRGETLEALLSAGSWTGHSPSWYSRWYTPSRPWAAWIVASTMSSHSAGSTCSGEALARLGPGLSEPPRVAATTSIDPGGQGPGRRISSSGGKPSSELLKACALDLRMGARGAGPAVWFDDGHGRCGRRRRADSSSPPSRTPTCGAGKSH